MSIPDLTQSGLGAIRCHGQWSPAVLQQVSLRARRVIY